MISDQEKFIVFYILLTNIWVTTLLSATVASAGGAAAGGGLYFPLAELALRVPPQVPAGAHLLRVPVARRHASTPATASDPTLEPTEGTAENEVAYSVRHGTGDGTVLAVNSSTGELRLADAVARRSEALVSAVTLVASEPGAPAAELRLNVTLLPDNDAETFDCDTMVKDLCFWPAAIYQIPENRPPTLLGPLGPRYLSDICPQYTLLYTLDHENGSSTSMMLEAVEVAEGAREPWLLRTRQSLDRETAPPSGMLRVRASCLATFNPGSSSTSTSEGTASPSTSGTTGVIPSVPPMAATTEVIVVVLDEDDSPLQLQEHPEMNVYLNNSRLTRGTFVDGPALSFTDADTLEPNSYTFTLLDDDAGLFLLPECAQDQAEHLGREMTSISCRIEAAKTDDLPQDPYTFVMQANDTSLMSGVVPFSHIDVKVNIHSGPAPSESTMMKMKMSLAMTEMPTSETMSTEMMTSTMTSLPPPVYPQKAKVLRTAAAYARVVQPTIDVDATSSRQPAFKFSLAADAHGLQLPLAITARGGIVYVSDAASLRTAATTLMLDIMWNPTSDSGNGGSSKVEITVVNASSIECMYRSKMDMSDSMQKNMMNSSNKTSDKKTDDMSKDTKSDSMKMDTTKMNGTMTKNSKDDPSMKKESIVDMPMKNMDIPPTCASQSMPKTCVSLCGIGSGTKAGAKPTGGCTWTMTRGYSTCSPDATTCPDGTCDPLEDLHPGLCPQDCSLMQSTNVNATRGIVGGSGICTCDATARCSCFAATAPPPPHQSTVAAAPLNTDCPHKGANPSCGGLCQLFLILVSLCIIAGVIAILLWRYKKRHGSLTCPSCPTCPPLPCTCPPRCCQDCVCKNDALFSWLPKRLQRHPPPAVAPTPTSRVSPEFDHPPMQSVDAHLLPYGLLAPLGQLNPLHK